LPIAALLPFVQARYGAFPTPAMYRPCAPVFVLTKGKERNINERSTGFLFASPGTRLDDLSSSFRGHQPSALRRSNRANPYSPSKHGSVSCRRVIPPPWENFILHTSYKNPFPPPP